MDARQLLTADPKLIFELASRMDPPEVIADRYGLDTDFLLQMMEVPHVKRAIADKRAELDKGGFVLAAKARLMFEDLLPEVYLRAKSKDATLSGILESAKFLRQVAGLDKQDPAERAQDRFSITINFSGASGPAGAQVVVNVGGDEHQLPEPPSYLASVPKLADVTDLEYVE